MFFPFRLAQSFEDLSCAHVYLHSHRVGLGPAEGIMASVSKIGPLSDRPCRLSASAIRLAAALFLCRGGQIQHEPMTAGYVGWYFFGGCFVVFLDVAAFAFRIDELMTASLSSSCF